MIIILRLPSDLQAALVALPTKVGDLTGAIKDLTDAVRSGENDELASLKDQLAQSSAALQAAIAANKPQGKE